MQGDAEHFFSSREYMEDQFFRVVPQTLLAWQLLEKLQRYANESIDSTNCGDWLRIGGFHDTFTRLNLALALRAMGATEVFIQQVYETIDPTWEIPPAA